MTNSPFIQLGSDAHDIFAIAQIASVYPEMRRITEAHRKVLPRLHNVADMIHIICIRLIGGGGRDYAYSSKGERDTALRKISETLAPTIVNEPLLAIDMTEPPVL